MLAEYSCGHTCVDHLGGPDKIHICRIFEGKDQRICSECKKDIFENPFNFKKYDYYCKECFELYKKEYLKNSIYRTSF